MYTDFISYEFLVFWIFSYEMKWKKKWLETIVYVLTETVYFKLAVQYRGRKKGIKLDMLMAFSYSLYAICMINNVWLEMAIMVTGKNDNIVGG